MSHTKLAPYADNFVTDRWEVKGVATLGIGGCENNQNGVSIFVDVFSYLELIKYYIS